METLTKEQEIDYIEGRIIDEHRKHSYHSPDEWARFAASKIQSQWKEYWTADRDKRILELEKQLNELDYDLPENMPLYMDSGLWQLRSDDMNEVLLHQFVHEKFIDFINRCKQYNREEILKP